MQKTDKYSFNEIFLPCIIEHGLLRVLSYTRRQIFLMKICLSTYHVKNWNRHKQICIRYSRHDVRFLYFDLRRLLKRSWFSGVISLFQWASKFHKQIMPPRNLLWWRNVRGNPAFQRVWKITFLCEIKVLSTWIKISNQRNLWICSHSYIL